MQNILAPQIFEKNKYITNLVNLASNFEFGKKKKKKKYIYIYIYIYKEGKKIQIDKI